MHVEIVPLEYGPRLSSSARSYETFKGLGFRVKATMPLSHAVQV